MILKQVTIPIIKSNYSNTTSMKFKGELSLISTEHGIILDWKINLSKIFIDTYTTPSWFDKKNAAFFRREELFKELKLKQEKRPTKSSNNIVELSEEQIKKTNIFLNNRISYTSTIKNIVQLLKGNNPGGEVKSPKSAELIVDTENRAKNFVVLLDDLMIKKTHREKQRNLFDSYAPWAEKISLSEFSKLNTTIESAFDFMQREKEEHEFPLYLSRIKEYYKQYNTIVSQAESIVTKARRRYGQNIDKRIHKLPFGLKDKSQFQKAHIIDVHKLKLEIIEALRNGRKTSAIEAKIEDPENFIPLPESIHRKFDQNHITYDENGELILINDKSETFYNQMVDERYKHMDEFFLTKTRKKYIKQRNADVSSV